MRGTRFWQSMVVAAALGASPGALADGEVCHLHRELSVERQLRRLAIDLRGTVPDMAEYEAVAGKSEVPESVIDAYLATDEFRLQMRRYHERLLWTNPLVELGDVGFALTANDLGGKPVYFVTSQTKRKLFRGGDGTHICQDKPQSELGYDASGLPIAEPKGTDMGGPWSAEGWVEVHPYWEPDPTKTVRVCAFDAQKTATYVLSAGDPDAGEHACDSVSAILKSKTCGCGPEMAYCLLTPVVQPQVLASMREQVLRLVDDHTSGDRPYSQLLTTKKARLNGPLSHYYRYLASRQSLGRTQSFVQPSDGKLPEVPFTQGDTWVEYERGGKHAGLLTMPAYLLRFQTNRGRANRYRIAFQGQYFQPPSAKDFGCSKEGDDLTERCVCRHCHQGLEPMAAYFGRFVEAGSVSLFDFSVEFPTYTACKAGVKPALNGWCERFYSAVPDHDDPDIKTYKLKALRWADSAHPEVKPHFEGGPEAMAKVDIESGLFHRVAVRLLFEWLMKREANLDPTSPGYEGELLDGLGAEFAAHDDVKKIVKRLVQLATYRRAP